MLSCQFIEVRTREKWEYRPPNLWRHYILVVESEPGDHLRPRYFNPRVLKVNSNFKKDKCLSSGTINLPSSNSFQVLYSLANENLVLSCNSEDDPFYSIDPIENEFLI